MASLTTRISRYVGDRRIIFLIVAAILILLLRGSQPRTAGNIREFDKNTIYAQRDTLLPDDSNEENVGWFNNTQLMEHLGEFNLWMESLTLQKVPEDILKSSTCPACYGTDMCSDILSGAIQVHIPEKPSKENLRGVYFGSSRGQYVVLKQLSSKEEYGRLDQFVCNNITHRSNCDVSKAIVSKDSFVLKENAFLPRNLYLARHISGTQNTGTTYALCADNELISELSTVYDKGGHNKLSANESIIFWFSAAINPEPMIMQFLQNQFEAPLQIPRYFGACGRTVVEEAIGRTLGDFLDEEWNFRADIASQLLEIIDNFLYGDTNWMLLWTDMILDNLAVGETGEIFLIDTEDIVIVNKKHAKTVNGICNWEDCIQPYAKNLMDISSPSHGESCAHLPSFGEHAMYLFLCHMLSDDPAHRIAMENNPKLKHMKGLLHGAPEDITNDLKEVFDQCTRETKPGGRVAAMYDLKDILAAYTYDYSSYESEFDLEIMRKAGLAK